MRTIIIAMLSITNNCTIGNKYSYTYVVEEILIPRDLKLKWKKPEVDLGFVQLV